MIKSEQSDGCIDKILDSIIIIIIIIIMSHNNFGLESKQWVRDLTSHP